MEATSTAPKEWRESHSKKKVAPMVHNHRNAFMIIAGAYTLIVTVTAASCLGPAFAVYAILGILAGGGLAWAKSHRHE